MSTEAAAAGKRYKDKRAAERKRYYKVSYTYVRLSLSVLAAFCIILAVLLYRIQQYRIYEQSIGSEYNKLLAEYNALEEQAGALSERLNAVEDKNDSTEHTLNKQAAILNEQDAAFSHNLDEFQKKTEELQKKLDELEKAKEEIVGQLNGISYLPDITDLPLTQPVPMAVSYASDPVRLLSYRLDSLSANANMELTAYNELSDTVNKDKPILDDYPTVWPVKGPVTSGFGLRQMPLGGTGSEYHTGLDIAVPMYSDVKAAGGGYVKLAEYDGGYGYLVIIDHGMGIETYYGHNSRLLVQAGDKITRGQAIAKSGSTGNSTGPHVHYEVRVNGKAVNPINYVTLSD